MRTGTLADKTTDVLSSLPGEGERGRRNYMETERDTPTEKDREERRGGEGSGDERTMQQFCMEKQADDVAQVREGKKA